MLPRSAATAPPWRSAANRRSKSPWGPKGSFENGNIGALMRRVPVERVVSAALPNRGTPKPPRAPKTPRVVELLRKAIEWQALIESGQLPNQAEVARREGITRARVTQVMGMLRLAPEIRKQILSLLVDVRRSPISERTLRLIETLPDHLDQIREFGKLLSPTVSVSPPCGRSPFPRILKGTLTDA